MPEPTEAGGRNTAAVRELEALSKIGPRRAGSEPERRAARQIDARLRDFGRDVDLEPIRVRPNFALTHLVHAVAGVIASGLSRYVPLAGPRPASPPPPPPVSGPPRRLFPGRSPLPPPASPKP